jgi:LysR family cyn operon transcriptional activator
MLLRHARYLVAIADHGSFTRAAAELHVSQPALSQQIRQLEEMLGARLLDRTGRIVRPTDAGRAYIDHARRALREFEAGRRAIHDVENLDSGALRLAFTPTFTTYLVGPLVRQFHGRHPGIGISVDVLAQTEMETALSEDRIDLGVAFGTVQSDDIVARPLYEECLCLVVGEGHSAFDHAELAASGLDGMDLALLDTTFVTRAAIDRYLQANAAHPRIAVESNSVGCLLATLRGGGLATIMPQAAASEITGLKAIQLLPPIASRTVSVLQRDGAYRTAASRAFVRMLEAWDWASLRGDPPAAA